MARSSKITTRAALVTLLSWQNGVSLDSLNWQIKGLGLPEATPADLQAIGAFRSPVTLDWRLSSVDVSVHMDRGQALNNLSFRHKSASPEWQAARSTMIRRWIVADMVKQ
jgi:hypothetical protein